MSSKDEGAYVHGLYLQGAKWCRHTRVIRESDARVLFDMLPIIWLRPLQKDEITFESRYKCPVYKTSLRRGVLSTTGHSTNYVLTINIPIDTYESHWVNRGKQLTFYYTDTDIDYFNHYIIFKLFNLY